MAYQSNGYIDFVTDPLGRQTSFVYDGSGRVTKQILPGGRQINFAYDANGNMTSLTPPEKPEHEFAYNSVDLTTEYNPPEVGGDGATGFSYNLAKQPTLVTRPDGKTIGFEYDVRGRLQKLIVPEGNYTYVYHATTGNLTNIIAPDGGILNYTYDGSLPTKVIWDGAVEGSVGVTYNNEFQVTSQNVNNANTISLSYNNDGQLTQVGGLSLSYNAQTGMLTDNIIGSVKENFTYNSFGEVNRFQASYGGSNIFEVNYATRDKLGRIVTKTETVNGESHTFSYSYDPNNDRLTDVYRDNVLISHYDYDANGNRVGYSGSNGTASGVYDDQDRMLSYGGNSYQYSANGELQSKTGASGTTRYEYDVLGNLRTVVLPDGKRIEYVIDGEGRRVGRRVNGSLVQGFIYQNSLIPVAELDGSGNVVTRFVYATGINVPDYMVKGGITYRIVTDHLGSPRLVVNTGTGEIIQRLEYDEFGNVTLDTNPGFQPFGFAGGLYDKDTGLVRFGARDYDAETGRWTSKDPGLFNDGFNMYCYTGNDPINYVDSLGFNRIKRDTYGHFEYDAFGVALLLHYLYGGGKEVHLYDNPSWSSYMKNNSILQTRLNRIIAEQANDLKNGCTKTIDLTMAMEIDGGESIIGYQYLHGTNADVGGFQMYGTISKDKYGNIHTNLTYQWNDIIDPNFIYKTDRWKSIIAERLSAGQAEAYIIRIRWHD